MQIITGVADRRWTLLDLGPAGRLTLDTHPSGQWTPQIEDIAICGVPHGLSDVGADGKRRDAIIVMTRDGDMYQRRGSRWTREHPSVASASILIETLNGEGTSSGVWPWPVDRRPIRLTGAVRHQWAAEMRRSEEAVDHDIIGHAYVAAAEILIDSSNHRLSAWLVRV